MKDEMANLGLTLLAALILAPAASAQNVVAIGGEFQVNSYTSGGQYHPSLAPLAGGGFVAVWSSNGSSGTDSSWSSIQGRLLAADGTPLGEDFQVNTHTVESQRSPKVTGLTDGSFVAIWSSYTSSGSDSSSSSVQGRRFAGDGMPLGEDFQVNTYTPGSQWPGSVAGLADGTVVAVWSSQGSGGADRSESGILGRRFAAGGSALGGDFQVNSYTLYDQGSPRVAALPGGGFEVVWTSGGSSGTDTRFMSVQGRRFAAGGAPVGDDFQINTYTTGYQWRPAIATLADGGIVVVWQSDGSSGTDSYGDSVQGQRFAADGSAVGHEFQVNTYTAYSQGPPAVAAGGAGGFVVVWESSEWIGLGHALQSIQGQRFAADGRRLAGELQITSQIVDRQEGPAVVILDDAFLASWQSVTSSGTDDEWYSIQSRRYAAPRFALSGLGDKCLDVEGAGGRASLRGRSPAAVGIGREASPEAEILGAGNPSDTTPVNLYRCHGGDNQRWQLELSAVPQRIRGLGGKCLVPATAGAASGDPVVIGECDRSGALWRLVSIGHAKPTTLRHVETELCLDVALGASSDADGTPTQLFDCHGGANQIWRPAAEVCTRDSNGLCLNQERFRVDLDWHSFDSTFGSGKAVPVGGGDSGLLWFFEADNWEMLIKVLDGCAINDRFWVFAAATTTVEYDLRVTDTALGTVRDYFNLLGNSAAAINDTGAFANCSVAGSAGQAPPARVRSRPSGVTAIRRAAAPLKGSCIPSPTNMCLSDDRFSVEVEWRDYLGNTGSAQVVDVRSPDSGMFWFFGPANWEMLVKVLDACDVNGKFLFLGAASTDVEYTVTVTDTESGVSWQHTNPLGNPSEALVHWFETCL